MYCIESWFQNAPVGTDAEATGGVHAHGLYHDLLFFLTLQLPLKEKPNFQNKCWKKGKAFYFLGGEKSYTTLSLSEMNRSQWAEV
jgi:hypothetical protein